MNVILEFPIVEDISPLKIQLGLEAETKEFCDFIIENMVSTYFHGWYNITPIEE